MSLRLTTRLPVVLSAIMRGSFAHRKVQSARLLYPVISQRSWSFNRVPIKSFCTQTTEMTNLKPNSISQVVEDTAEDDILYRQLVIECKGHDKAVLKSYETFVSAAAQHLEVNITDIETPRYHRYMRTLLKSVFVVKKHRVQYEIRTHFKIFTVRKITGSTADTFLEYIQRNIPEGVSMKVTKHRLEAIPEHIQTPKIAAQ